MYGGDTPYTYLLPEYKKDLGAGCKEGGKVLSSNLGVCLSCCLFDGLMTDSIGLFMTEISHLYRGVCLIQLCTCLRFGTSQLHFGYILIIT